MRWVLVAAFLLGAVVAKPDDLIQLDVDTFGDLSGVYDDDVDDSPTKEMSVTFENKYSNQSLILFWEDDNGHTAKISDINRNGQSGVNTFVNHKFFASTDAAGKNRVNPPQVLIFM